MWCTSLVLLYALFYDYRNTLPQMHQILNFLLPQTKVQRGKVRTSGRSGNRRIPALCIYPHTFGNLLFSMGWGAILYENVTFVTLIQINYYAGNIILSAKRKDDRAVSWNRSIVLTSAEQFFLYFENSIVYFPKSAVQNPGILFGKPFIVHCKIYIIYIFDRSGVFWIRTPTFSDRYYRAWCYRERPRR